MRAGSILAHKGLDPRQSQFYDEEKEIAMTDDSASPQPARSRAVFSTEDFALMKEAIAHYVKVIEDKPESSKFVNLYHRLGRLD